MGNGIGTRFLAVRAAAAATSLLAGLLSGCGCAGMAWVELAGERFCVEIADDDAERARGLMFRDELPATHGMLFVFEREQPQSFWMKNTRIPLDILYFDAAARLVSVSRRTPPCTSATRCPGYPSRGPARYVLELNAGTAERLGVQPGDELTLGPDIRY